LFENLVVMEALKSKYNRFKPYQLCYYRDSNNNEVDLIFDYITHLDVMEIKSSQTFDKSFLKGLNYIRGILPEKVRNTTICYSGETEQMIDGARLVNYKNMFRE